MATESDPGFRSGAWRGFYVYPQGHRSVLEEMIAWIDFGGGLLKGDGTDPVGRFYLRGGYDLTSRACSWVKSYPGRHQVNYVGVQSGVCITGSWEIACQLRGSFRLWPAGNQALEGEFFVDEALVEDHPPLVQVPHFAYRPLQGF